MCIYRNTYLAKKEEIKAKMLDKTQPKDYYQVQIK